MWLNYSQFQFNNLKETFKTFWLFSFICFYDLLGFIICGHIGMGFIRKTNDYWGKDKWSKTQSGALSRSLNSDFRTNKSFCM